MTFYENASFQARRALHFMNPYKKPEDPIVLETVAYKVEMVLHPAYKDYRTAMLAAIRTLMPSQTTLIKPYMNDIIREMHVTFGYLKKFRIQPKSKEALIKEVETFRKKYITLVNGCTAEVLKVINTGEDVENLKQVTEKMVKHISNYQFYQK